MNTAILFSKIHLQGFVKHPDSEKAKKKKFISIIRNVCKKTLINSKFWQPSYVTITLFPLIAVPSFRYIVSVIIITDRLYFVSHIQVLPINIIVSWMMIVILHKNIVYYIIRVINNTVEKIQNVFFLWYHFLNPNYPLELHKKAPKVQLKECTSESCKMPYLI